MNPCLPLGVALLLMPLSALPAQAASAAYELDPVHTRVMLAVEHAGFSKAIGTVSGSSGHLQFDPEDWTTATLEVSVPLQRLDLGDEKWNQAVLARNLLDVEEFPSATFVSTRIEPIDPQHASVYGTLTLHGVPKEVKLEVTLNALKRHPLPPFRRTAGFSATATLSRADFGIDAWKSVIGDSVELRIEVEATRTRKNDDDNDEEQQNLAQPPIPTTEPPTP
jgi:polyisoprenoid-binding protein YceI